MEEYTCSFSRRFYALYLEYLGYFIMSSAKHQKDDLCFNYQIILMLVNVIISLMVH